MKCTDKLCTVYQHLMSIKGECAFQLIKEYNMSELTLRQIEYIKLFDQHEYMTISKLAEILDLSKPSITEMIKKFIKLDCVYKQKCSEDGRVSYLKLTQKGQNIARFEHLSMLKVVSRISESLTEEELEQLAELLGKIK